MWSLCPLAAARFADRTKNMSFFGMFQSRRPPQLHIVGIHGRRQGPPGSAILERMAVVLRGDPPSTYCALAFVEGQPGAAWRFLGATLVRSLFIAPGLALVGQRGKQLVFGALGASVSISAILILFYGYQRAKSLQTGKPAPWDNNWGILSSTAAAQTQAAVAGLHGAFRR
jgi:hypothetical protein